MIEEIIKKDLLLGDKVLLLSSDNNGNRHYAKLSDIIDLGNRDNYQYFNRAIALNTSNDSPINIAIIGDSNTDKNEVFHKPLSEKLINFGEYQTGFINFHTNFYPPTGILRSMTSGWTLRDKLTGGIGLNLSDAESNNGNDYIQFETLTHNIKFDTVRIIFLRQAGGGEFDYKIDSGPTTTVSTDGSGVSFIDIATSYQPHIVTLYVKGNGNVRLLGAITKSNQKEFSIHKLTQPGAVSGHFANNAMGQFETQLEYLNLDLCIINLGTNDITFNITTSVYRSNLIAIINRIRSVSNCSILIISPSDTGFNPIENESEYDKVCKEVAFLNGCNILSLYDKHGEHSSAYALGVFIDEVHYNYTYAGYMNASFIYKEII